MRRAYQVFPLGIEAYIDNHLHADYIQETLTESSLSFILRPRKFLFLCVIKCFNFLFQLIESKVKKCKVATGRFKPTLFAFGMQLSLIEKIAYRPNEFILDPSDLSQAEDLLTDLLSKSAIPTKILRCVFLYRFVPDLNQIVTLSGKSFDSFIAIGANIRFM